jgi:hypothetical protein
MLAAGPGEALVWDLSRTGPSELGAISVEGQVWRGELSSDGSTAYVADPSGGRGRLRAIHVATGAEVALADGFGQIPGVSVSPIATRDGIVAGWVGGGIPGRVVDLRTGRLITELDPCDVPTSIDGAGRWLLATVTDRERGCGGPASRVIDPMSGDVLVTLPEWTGGSDIGPPGTISDGIAAAQVNGGIAFLDLATGADLGRIDIDSAWTPAFSSDGRHVALGSGDDGGFAIDVERVLAGDPHDAIVMNPLPGAGATFSVVVGDHLITGHGGEVLRFWRLSDGSQDLALPTASIDSTYLFPTPDERFLYYESDGHLLRRFPLRLDDLVELAERRAQRWFRASECERYELADDCATFVAAGRPTTSATSG